MILYVNKKKDKEFTFKKRNKVYLLKQNVGKCGGRLVPNRSIGLVSWVKPRGAALAYVTVYS